MHTRQKCRLKLIHTKAALIAVTDKKTAKHDAVSLRIASICSHVSGRKITCIFYFEFEIMDQCQRNHQTPGALITFPDRHTGNLTGAGQDIIVGVMDKQRIVKNIQTGAQHIFQRIFGIHGQMQL